MKSERSILRIRALTLLLMNAFGLAGQLRIREEMLSIPTYEAELSDTVETPRKAAAFCLIALGHRLSGDSEKAMEALNLALVLKNSILWANFLSRNNQILHN
ncbi:MAG: hypothetical protein P1P86_09475 [Bacteroidales bacterium]|nr:hypothetical protein [Bacteroidales bacterium]